MPSEWATTTRVSGPIDGQDPGADRVADRGVVEVPPELGDRPADLLPSDLVDQRGQPVRPDELRGGVEHAGASGHLAQVGVVERRGRVGPEEVAVERHRDAVRLDVGASEGETVADRGDPSPGDLVRSPQLVEGAVHANDDGHVAQLTCSARYALTAARAVGNRRPSAVISSQRGSRRAVAKVCGGRSANQQRTPRAMSSASRSAKWSTDGQRRPGDGGHVEHEGVGGGGVDRREHPAVGAAHVGRVQRARRSAARAARGPARCRTRAARGRRRRAWLELGHPDAVELAQHESQREHDARRARRPAARRRARRRPSPRRPRTRCGRGARTGAARTA